MPWMRFCFLSLLLGFPGMAVLLAEGAVGEHHADVARQSLEGRWEANVGRMTLPLRFYDDGTFVLRDESGTYRIEGHSLIVQPDEADPISYQFELQDSFLILRGGDLAQDLRFARAPRDDAALRGYFRWLFDYSFNTAGERLYRIVTILGIVALSILFLNFLRMVSHFLIFSDIGPLRFIYRRYKVKTRTIHSVVLNLLKYIVCLTALGHIFAELGINYATYFASLSVIGLAVGFGSQGLVQDIVTGFFLIFDSQFGVGDMVEISGQTGVVEELGLRTTRLRNFVGQVVVIPNRNIALVGNYSKGAVKAYIDVAVKDENSLAKAGDLLRVISEELHSQFPGTLMKKPKDLGSIRLKTGEAFRRLEFDLWPNQHQALIDGQILPRIREIFAREEIEIPNNRISISYRLPDKKTLVTWRSRFARRKRHDAGPPEPFPDAPLT